MCVSCFLLFGEQNNHNFFFKEYSSVRDIVGIYIAPIFKTVDLKYVKNTKLIKIT